MKIKCDDFENEDEDANKQEDEDEDEPAFETETTKKNGRRQIKLAKKRFPSSQKMLGASVHNIDRGAYRSQQVMIRKPQRDVTWARIIGAIKNGNRGSIKALGINPDTTGGYLVPLEQSNQVIELLRSKSLFMAGGAGERLATYIPMSRDTITIPRYDSGVTTSWVGENATISDNTPNFGQITLTAKKLATLVKISNELLADSDPEVDEIISNDMARAMANAIDNAVLEGTGVVSEPLGLDNIADVTKTAKNAVPGYDDLVDMITRVVVEDVEFDDSWAWIIHPRELGTLRKIEDSEGHLIWTGGDGIGRQMAGNISDMLLGYPWLTTTQISIDTDNNNETHMFFGRWRDVVIGMRKTLEIMVSSEAGTSFETDQTWIRAIIRADVNIRHPESIEILTDVRTS